MASFDDNNLFERTSMGWVRYSEYEWKTTEDGTLFLTSTETAQPSINIPLSEYRRIVLDAINIGRMEAMCNISNERLMMTLAMTMTDNPMAVHVSFQREYAERYEWMKQQFIDIAFTYQTSVLFYGNYDTMTPEQHLLMQPDMESFGDIAPTYRIAIFDRPTIVWDFHSIMLGVQIMSVSCRPTRKRPSVSASIVCRPLLQANRVRFSEVHSAKISITYIRAERRKRRNNRRKRYYDRQMDCRSNGM